MSSVTISCRNIHNAQRSIVECTVPPDKSILHRALFLGALSESIITIPVTESVGDDIISTINALRQLAVPIEFEGSQIVITGVGKNGLHKSDKPIDCRNSGTTARLLMGILSAQDFESTLVGDSSLSTRPMKRIATVLNEELGADIITSESGTLPVCINGRTLQNAAVRLPVASAQIKSSLLLAAFCSGTSLEVIEPLQSRDHTERMFRQFGVDVQTSAVKIFLPERRTFVLPKEFDYNVPGDISSASFLIAAAAITRTDISINNVGINQTRSGVLQVLSNSGIPIFVNTISEFSGERSGNVRIAGSHIITFRPFSLDASSVPNVQDEIPALSVIALFADGVSNFAGASELRLKESDRISTLYHNLTAFGANIVERSDGLTIHGDKNFIGKALVIDHSGDHRIAMAMSVAALCSGGEVIIPDSNVVTISYPNFFETLTTIASQSGCIITSN
ncbi:MAG TPA: 3-phosphoshikimate 1-carboxyvinyltransferase [Candidatus Kapabacteria bacterium]|nr:3-phosphoshikimate 1-carboxyvinyltransferase [Candidatus Kapabacteria bacterium]